MTISNSCPPKDQLRAQDVPLICNGRMPTCLDSMTHRRLDYGRAWQKQAGPDLEPFFYLVSFPAGAILPALQIPAIRRRFHLGGRVNNFFPADGSSVPIAIPITVPASTCAGTATPAPAAASPAIRAPSTTAATPGPGALARRRAHKGEVDLDGLAEQIRVMRAIDCPSCLLQGGVFDQGVSLGSGMRLAESPRRRSG